MDKERRYYVYAYLRAQDSESGKAGTPYYIGKGKGLRYINKAHSVTVPRDRTKIIFLGLGLTEHQALSAEKHFIRYYGRLDTGTGCLRNLTDGGEGTSGYALSTDHKQKISAANKGRKFSHRSLQRRVDTRLARGGFSPSEETRHKISDSLSGRKQPLELVEKRAERRRGVKRPDISLLMADRNKARARRVSFNGETLTVPEWSERLGIPTVTLYVRLRSGWSIERTLSTPLPSWSRHNLLKRDD